MNDKGFIRFAGQEQRERVGSQAAKVMKPFSELNRSRLWHFNGFCSAADLVGRYENGDLEAVDRDMLESEATSGGGNVGGHQGKWANPGAPEWCKTGVNTAGVGPARKVEPGSLQGFRRWAS